MTATLPTREHPHLRVLPERKIRRPFLDEMTTVRRAALWLVVFGLGLGGGLVLGNMDEGHWKAIAAQCLTEAGR